MKNFFYKACLVAALGYVGSTVVHAQTIANNDLLLGFTSPSAASVGGVQYDYILDLGQLLGTSAQQIDLSGNANWNASTFTTDMGSAVLSGNAYAGIFGAKAGSTGDDLLSATATPATGNYSDYEQGADFPASVTLGAVAQSGESVFNNISTAPGKAGNNPNSFGLYVPSPLETVSGGSTTLDLTVYEATYDTLTKSASAFTDEGYVSVLFGSDGDIDGVAWDEQATAIPTPEPATYALGGLGMLMLVLRRKWSSKRA